MVLRQTVPEKFKGIFRRIGELEKFDVLRRDRARVDEGLEVQHPVPVLAAVNHNENFLGQLVRLGEGKDLEQFVHRAEAAGKNHQPLRQIREPELAHEEVVELKVQRRSDVLVGILFEGKLDVESDAFSAGLVCAE